MGERLGRSLSVLALLLVPELAYGDASPRIIGGTPVKPGEFPAVVAITVDVTDGRSICTGELVTPEWILTAAHCADPSTFGYDTDGQLLAHMEVHFHTTAVMVVPGTVVAPDRLVVNPAYLTSAGGLHDIALVHLATAVTDVDPLAVNFDPARAAIGTPTTQVGFGVYTDGGIDGTAGEERVITGQAVRSCDDFGGASLLGDDRRLCFDSSDGKAQCFGDSGGPALATIAGAQVVIGITEAADVDCANHSVDTALDTERAFVLANAPDVLAVEPPADGSGDHTETPEPGGCSTNGAKGGWMWILAMGGFVARVRASRYMSRHATRNAGGRRASRRQRVRG